MTITQKIQAGMTEGETHIRALYEFIIPPRLCKCWIGWHACVEVVGSNNHLVTDVTASTVLLSLHNLWPGLSKQ